MNMHLFDKPHEQRAEEFARDNADFVQRFIEIARTEKSRGRKRIGAKAICERLRWEGKATRSCDPWKVNNSVVSPLTRIICDRAPDIADMFEFRGDTVPSRATGRVREAVSVAQQPTACRGFIASPTPSRMTHPATPPPRKLPTTLTPDQPEAKLEWTPDRGDTVVMTHEDLCTVAWAKKVLGGRVVDVRDLRPREENNYCEIVP